MHDLAEHTSSLLSVIGALLTAVGIMIWRKLNSIEGKVDKNAQLHYQCREELPRKFVTKEEFKDHRHDFKEWQNGRRELWEAINNHTHEETNGKVVR